MKKIKPECPECHKSEHVVSNGKQQYLCKTCKRYFSSTCPKTEYSKGVKFVLKTIFMFFYPKFKTTKVSIKEFAKKVSASALSQKENFQVEYKYFTSTQNPMEEATVQIDASVKDALLLVRQNNSFVVVRGLNVRRKICFKDYDINISSPGPIKRDYDFYELDRLYRN